MTDTRDLAAKTADAREALYGVPYPELEDALIALVEAAERLLSEQEDS